MSVLETLNSEQQRRLHEAAEWRSRIGRDPSQVNNAEYVQWLSDPGNVAAKIAIERGCESVVTVQSAPAMLELRRQALSRLQAAGAGRSQQRRVPLSAVLAAMFIAVTAAAVLYLNQFRPTDYETDIAERRVVALADGSRISMDSDTRVRVLYRNSARSITLERGRSRFDVAHDPSRPFSVTAGAQTVVAIGTSFDVERLPSTVLVTLIQGQVVIKRREPDVEIPPISLQAGEQLVAAIDVRPVVIPADPQVARAWEAGRLLFRDEPLGNAVTRVNRYTIHPIKVDSSITDIRISGVFNAGDISSFVSAVTSYFDVQASTSSDNTILLERRL